MITYFVKAVKAYWCDSGITKWVVTNTDRPSRAVVRKLIDTFFDTSWRSWLIITKTCGYNKTVALATQLKKQYSSYTQCFPAAASLASVINIGRQDITPLDYFYWGHLKQQFYDIKPNTAPELKYELPQEYITRSISQEWNITRTLQESDGECNWRADVCIWPHGVVIWLIWYHVKCLKSTVQKHVLIFTGCPVITAEHFTRLYSIIGQRSTLTILIMYWIILSSLVSTYLSVCYI